MSTAPRTFSDLPRNLTTNFTWKEVVATQTNLPNIPPPELIFTILNTADQMEKVRDILGGHPIHTSSWYRSEAVNIAVGGSTTSEHRVGRAVDFTCPGFGSPLEIVKLLSRLGPEIQYNQLIWETKGNPWVHISFPFPLIAPKLQVQTYKYYNGRFRYLPGIVE